MCELYTTVSMLLTPKALHTELFFAAFTWLHSTYRYPWKLSILVERYTLTQQTCTDLNLFTQTRPFIQLTLMCANVIEGYTLWLLNITEGYCEE